MKICVLLLYLFLFLLVIHILKNHICRGRKYSFSFSLEQFQLYNSYGHHSLGCKGYMQNIMTDFLLKPDHFQLTQRGYQKGASSGDSVSSVLFTIYFLLTHALVECFVLFLIYLGSSLMRLFTSQSSGFRGILIMPYASLGMEQLQI